MNILYDDGLNPYTHPVPYDPDSKVFYSRSYRPPTRASNTEYIEGVDLVIPSTPNGFMYECSSGGISASSEPTFTAQKGKITTDGTVKWKAVPYSLLLHTGDIIKAASSTWSGTNSETIDSEEIVDSIQTKFRLTAVPADATSATIVNSFTVTRANGDEEEFDRTLIISVKEL